MGSERRLISKVLTFLVEFMWKKSDSLIKIYYEK
jgi:hypothetical protein